jgi:hypothetical protein
MRKIKILENEIEVLRKELHGIHEYITNRNLLTIDEAKKRDYIVRTDYIGKITDAKIKKDFKAEIEKILKDKNDSIRTKILNYEFFDNEECIYILDAYWFILKEYEKKQIVLDMYGGK